MSADFRPANQRILIADDETEIREYLQIALRCRGYDLVETVHDGEEALERVKQGNNRFSLVLLDILMPRKNGLEALREIRQLDADLPVIMLSCASSVGTVVEAMKSGASDFLSKPISHEDLGVAVERALARPFPPAFTRANIPNTRTSTTLQFVPSKRLEPVLAGIGASLVPVLIRGETGVGKEIIARRLHDQSVRAGKPFLKLNCAALPPELVECELFGHEKGAFTGADQRKPGMFELADGGTILLDEIGDMDFKLQAKLLQVLQDHEFRRIGGEQVIRVNVRVIAATHCDLEEAIAAKRFRADLYYRLNVISVAVPALRERPDEIIPIAEFLIKKHSPRDSAVGLPPELQCAFLKYSWPGNVRELENVIRRFIVLRESESIIRELGKSDLAAQNKIQLARPHEHGSQEPVRADGSVLEKVNEAKKDAERQAIIEALNSSRWNRKKAAAALGSDYKSLLYKIKKLGIDDALLNTR